MGIYKIVNKDNGLFYLGSSKHLHRRWAEHKTLLNSKKHHSKKLQNAWNKYGKNLFYFEIIEKVETENNLLEKEQYFLDLLTPWKRGKGYNISKVANSPMKGRKQTKKFREAMKKIVYEKKYTQEDVKIIREKYLSGVYPAELSKIFTHLSFSCIEKIVLNAKSYDEEYEKIRKNKPSYNHAPFIRRIIPLEVKNSVVRDFEEEKMTVNELSEKYKISTCAIHSYLKGKIKNSLHHKNCEKIRFDFSNGIKIKFLCKKYKISYTTCRKIIDNKHPYDNK